MDISRQKLLWVTVVLIVVANTFPREARKLGATYGRKEVSFHPKPDLNGKQEDVHYRMLRSDASTPPPPASNKGSGQRPHEIPSPYLLS